MLENVGIKKLLEKWDISSCTSLMGIQCFGFEEGWCMVMAITFGEESSHIQG